MLNRQLRTTGEPVRRGWRIPAMAVAILAAVTACSPTAAVPAASPSGPAGAHAASAAPASAAADWNGFRGTASRSGVGDAGPVGKPVPNWTFHAKAAVPEELAIIGDQVAFASDDGTVYALDRATGAQRWSVTSDRAPLIGPAARDGRMYFLDGTGAAVALDASTGKTLWTSTTTYDGPGEPVIDGGAMYFGTADGYLVAIDTATGAEAWKLKPTPGTTRMHNPAVAEGRIFAGADGDGFIAVDATTHEVVWTGDTGGEVMGTASVNDGLAFVGTGPDAQDGHLRVFDAQTGVLRWVADQPRLTIPVAADGLVFSSTMDGLVQGMDLATGAVRWSIQLSGRIRPMAIAGSVLYVPADTERRVYALDAATGGKLWQFDVDESNDCCVAVTGGAVYVSTLAGTVYSIGGDGTAIAAVPFAAPGPTSTPAPTKAALAEIPVATTWSTSLTGMGFAPSCQIAVDPTTGRIWAPEAANDRIAIFDPDGTRVEEWGASGDGPGQFDFTRSNGDGYGGVAFDKDGSFFVLDVGNRRVQHFDRERKLLGEWGSFGNGAGQYSDPVGIVVGADGTVWVLDDRRSVVEHYTPTGEVLGSFDPFATTPGNDGANGLAIDAEGILYVSEISPTQVNVFDSNGTLVRTVGAGQFAEQAGTIAVDTTGRVYVTQGPERGSAPGVLVFDAGGEPVGGFLPQGTGDGQIVFPGGIALDGTGGIYVQDTLDDPALVGAESARLMRLELRKP